MASMPSDEWSPRLWLGADLFALSRLVLRNRLAVRPSDWPSLAVHLSFAALHTIAGRLEAWVLGRRIREAALAAPPIFVLGHWRTGTTLLHELLALDARHTAPTTYQCLSPCHFLLTEAWLPRLSRFVLPSRRPADNVTLAWEKPQEDEFALTLLGVPSPYNTMAFPNHPPADGAYLDFDGLSAREIDDWREAFLRFLKRVTLRDPRRLVLKSPAHTARARILREMFPDARFVHIVRDPYRVFVSTMNLWRAMYREQGYQPPTFRGLEEYVFETYLTLFRRIEEEKPRFAPRRFHELRYEDLVRDPVGELARVYDALELGEFGAYRPRLEAHLATLRGYETNVYEMTPQLRDEISRRWGEPLRRYGYVPSG